MQTKSSRGAASAANARNGAGFGAGVYGFMLDGSEIKPDAAVTSPQQAAAGFDCIVTDKGHGEKSRRMTLRFVREKRASPPYHLSCLRPKFAIS